MQRRNRESDSRLGQRKVSRRLGSTTSIATPGCDYLPKSFEPFDWLHQSHRRGVIRVTYLNLLLNLSLRCNQLAFSIYLPER
jgi:hypothetical protein